MGRYCPDGFFRLLYAGNMHYQRVAFTCSVAPLLPVVCFVGRVKLLVGILCEDVYKPVCVCFHSRADSA